MQYLSVQAVDRWASRGAVEEGRRLYESDCVLDYQVDGNLVEGTVQFKGRKMLARFEVLADGTIDSSRCPCRDCRERGVTCANVIAVGLAYLSTIADPDRDRRMRIEARKESMTAEDWKQHVPRVPADHEDAVPAELHIRLAKTWLTDLEDGVVKLKLQASYKDSKTRLDRISKSMPLTWSERDEYMLYVLEDARDGEPLGGEIHLPVDRFADALSEFRDRGLVVEGGDEIQISDEILQPHISIFLDQDDGELVLEHIAGDEETRNDVFLVGEHSGWMYSDGVLYPLDQHVPDDLRGLYRETIRIPRTRILQFLDVELPVIEKHMEVETSVASSQFKRVLGEPAMRLVVAGTPEEALFTLYADYEGQAGPPAGQETSDTLFCIPDPKDIMRFTVRNLDRERSELEWLNEHGLYSTPNFKLEPLSGTRAVMNFIGRDVPLIQRRGWTVIFEEGFSDLTQRAEWVHPVVEIRAAEEPGWFNIRYHYEDEHGEPVDESAVEHALVESNSCFEHKSRLFLLDMAAVDQVHDVFDDCTVKESMPYSGLKLGDIHAGYAMSSLKLIDGVRIDHDEAWQKRVAEQNRDLQLKQADVGSHLRDILRPYQKEGIHWLRYLENCGFAGILADEMGLGKTVQTLAWLEMERTSESARCGPALIVCPTSLVENWAEEAERFTPSLSVHPFTGPNRRRTLDKMDEVDLVVTSYALLRRDIHLYSDRRFSVAVLDEAQHIKNHSTQNAKAAKQIKAAHRLVLTGTPIENSITDLWSIVDFLMPKYLGSHRQFRESYELPIQNHGPEADRVQRRLKRKVHPFMLRRLKVDVVKELPPKIEKIAFCTMTRDQRRAYNQLLSSSRSQVYGLVAEKGFKQSRFEIFKTLTRLRQACCHLELLKMKDIKHEEPSGKLDMLHELLDEAMDGGNRILIFSQFVAMLKILKQELTARGVEYCYLDGSTRERMKEVNRFNDSDDIPVFLISLKAGGTGLNLTGADTVIHYDPWWNPAVEDQATDRAHRIGQRRTVYSMKLITRESVEEKVLALQRRKKSIIDATLSNDEQVMEQLNWEDVQELLSD